MSIPSVLLSGVKNESQDLTITTDVLEPNVLNTNQAVFVIPKKASVLDSKSALKVRVNWNGFKSNVNDNVGGKLFSGLLGMIKSARLYASGQLISDLRHAGEKIHLDNQFKTQEYKEQYCDVKHASESGFSIAEGVAQSGLNGAIQSADAHSTIVLGGDVDSEISIENAPYFRGIGYAEGTTAKTPSTITGKNDGLEMFLLLEELFPMLKDIQLPVRFMKDEIRIEIDWEQDKTKWLYSTGTYTPSDIVISEAVMFLDYITYNPEIDATLEQTINTTGVSIPFRQTTIITKQLGKIDSSVIDHNEDILLGQEGRAIMKIYIAKKYANTWTDGATGNKNQGYELQGDCRSERLKGEKFNCVINDLLIYDRDVVNNHEGYSYLSYAGEKPFTAYPDSFEENKNYGALAVGTDVLFTSDDADALDQVVLNKGATKGFIKDGIKGTQNWCAVDCSKYGSSLNPMNALRIGSTPVIFRLKRSSGTDDRTKSAVAITCFVEYLRLFDLRGGNLSVRDL